MALIPNSASDILKSKTRRGLPHPVEYPKAETSSYVQGADNYTELVLHGGRRVLHDKTLEKLEAVLPDDFERIPKSYLVRLSAVKQLHVHAGSQCTAELATGEVIPVGRTRYKALRERLGR